jgi:hypothetical protein
MWKEARELISKGVPSSFQDAPPQPLFMEGQRQPDLGRGRQRVRRPPQRFGGIVVGHAHPLARRLGRRHREADRRQRRIPIKSFHTATAWSSPPRARSWQRGSTETLGGWMLTMHATDQTRSQTRHAPAHSSSACFPTNTHRGARQPHRGRYPPYTRPTRAQKSPVTWRS